MRSAYFIGSALVIAAFACGAFSGQGESGGEDGGADAAKHADATTTDASPSFDAPPPTLACDAAIFCDDFENVVAPLFGFAQYEASDGGSFAIVMDQEGDAQSHALRVAVDTSDLADGAAPGDTALTTPLDAGGATTVTLEFDFRVTSNSLAYNTYGILARGGSEVIGVGANTNQLGQPYDTYSPPAHVQDDGSWHHVVASFNLTTNVGGTTIDGTIVQAGGPYTPGGPLIVQVGVFGCAAVANFANKTNTTVDFDNIVVRTN